MTRREKIKTKILRRVRYEGDCWLWTGPDSGKKGRGHGYPRMSLDGGTVAVHIALWVVENGPIPPRKQLDHTCVRRRCVNPAHLELTTPKQNQRRRVERTRCDEVRP